MSRTSEETVPILFTPPMWEQRINIVKKILLSYKIREICDLGCGSGRLLEEFVYYKGMERLIGVDLDEYELWNAVENCIPGVAGYINLRKKEMKIEILKGSILEPCDKIPFQIQAVSLCEVIEHIYLEQVSALTQNIFSYINPEYVIVTTPNKDFNFYFPDPSKFRHNDHKFEWTRSEFENWAENTANQFSYEVFFTGVGCPPPYIDKGFCTQIAVFHRLVKMLSRSGVPGTFTEIRSVTIPKNFPTNFEERFFNSFLYSFNLVRSWENADYSDGLPLSRIFCVPCLNVLCDGSEFRMQALIKRVLPKFGKDYEIRGDLIFVSNESPEGSENND